MKYYQELGPDDVIQEGDVYLAVGSFDYGFQSSSDIGMKVCDPKHYNCKYFRPIPQIGWIDIKSETDLPFYDTERQVPFQLKDGRLKGSTSYYIRVNWKRDGIIRYLQYPDPPLIKNEDEDEEAYMKYIKDMYNEKLDYEKVWKAALKYERSKKKEA